MKKILVLVMLLLLNFVGMVHAIPPVPPPIYTDVNCDQAKYYRQGILCYDTDDGKLYKWVSGSGMVELAATSGPGDILDVWNCSVGNCESLVADTGDSLDATNASYIIPFKVATDCSGVTAEGRACWDSDDNILYVGDGSVARPFHSTILYDAQTILRATTDNTPTALTVTEQTVVGRATGGNIAALAIDSDLSSVSANHDTVPSAKAVKDYMQPLDADLTLLSSPTAWRVFYSNGSSAITELALGSSGTYLKSGGATSAPSWDTPTGSGTVTGVGDCTGGACLDGTSDGGTYVSLYDGDSNYTKIQAGNSSADLTFILPTTAGATGGMLYFSGSNQLANLTAGAQYKLLSMGASVPAWTDTISISEINLPSSNSDPGTTVGQIKHDNTVTALTGGAVKWYDATDVRILVDLKTEPTAGDDEKAVLYDDGTKKFYLGTVAAGAAGKGYLWIPAGSMIPDSCAGLAQSDVGPNIVDYLAFDGITSEEALFSLSIEDWDHSTIKAKFVWAPSSEDDTQTVQWCLRCYAVSDGDSYDAALSAGEQCATADALGASDWSSKIQKITSATSAITVQGSPAQGDIVYCQVYRNVSGDNYEHDAWLLGVKIEYGKATAASW